MQTTDQATRLGWAPLELPRATRQLEVEEGELVILEGPDVPPNAGCRWRQAAGHPVPLRDVDGPRLVFEAPEGLANSALVFELWQVRGEPRLLECVAFSLNPDERAPIARARAPETALDGELVILDGSGSSADHDLRYEWIQARGPLVALDDPRRVRPQFRVPPGWTNTRLVFELVVRGPGGTSVDTVDLVVRPDATAPRVDAGPALLADEGETTTLLADIQGGSRRLCSWRQIAGPPVELDDPRATRPTFEAPEGFTNSRLAFELSVRDGDRTVIDTVQVMVNAYDDAPTAQAGTTSAARAGERIVLSGHHLELPGPRPEVRWKQVHGPRVAIEAATSRDASILVPSEFVNTFLEFELWVSDGTRTSIDRATVCIEPALDLVMAHAGDDRTAEPGSRVLLQALRDPSEVPWESLAWRQVEGPPVELDDAHAATTRFHAPARLENTRLAFELTVRAGGQVSIDTVAIVVGTVEDGLNASARADYDEGTRRIILRGSSWSPNGTTPLDYRWEQIEGPPLDFEADWTTTEIRLPADAEGELAFRLRVDDGLRTSYDEVRLFVPRRAHEPRA